MKKLAIILAFAGALTCLAGCEGYEDPENSLKDSDYDGLYDEFDPLPNDNEFRYYYLSSKDPDTEKSNEVSAKVDFRYFLEDKFNVELSKMSALLAYFGYPEKGVEWHISKNTYTNEQSELNACLVNFGFENIVRVGEYDEDAEDKYDFCSAYLGHHIFENSDGKKYQIVAANLIGYPTDLVWSSNFDIGADSEGYTEIGEEEHSLWTNKKHHKGFDVSANKIYPEITNYLNDVKENDITQIVWVVGHSRSGAIGNLLGKKLFDNNIKSVCYCYNNPNNTTESDPAVLAKYTNIYNIRPENDLLSRFPFAYQGFTSYGNQLNLNLTYPIYAEEYKRVFKEDFVGNSKETVDSILDLVKTYFPGREEMYEYSETFTSTIDLDALTYEDAEDEIVPYQHDIESAELTNITKLEIIENPDYIEGVTAKYLLKYSSKPIVIFRILGEIIKKVSTSELPVIDIITYVLSTFSFVKYILIDFVLEILDRGISLDFNKFGQPHSQKTTVVGSYCVLED